MKKLITLALAAVFFSCSKEATPEYTVVSGKFTGAPKGKFTIKGNAFEKEISVNEDGSFADTLYIDYGGTYEMAKNEIYLHKGKNLSFELDIQNLDNITFSGDLATENKYFAQKKQLYKDILGKTTELYTLEESQFLVKIDEFTQKSNELLEASTFVIDDFKQNEQKSIGYNKEQLLRSYLSMHPFFTDNQAFQVSDTYPKSNKTIDFDNAKDYDFSVAYRELVVQNFRQKVFGVLEEGKQTFSEKIAANIKNIKSQNIKNGIAEEFSSFVTLDNPEMETIYNAIVGASTDENFKKELTETFNKLKHLTKGKTSPKFNLENHKGGNTSLDDLKGKYVYIDLWATWCAPCIVEIPFMKELEKNYHGKNIEFVSISLDEKKDYDKWKKFVTDKQLGGIQLYGENGMNSKFAMDYALESIPRFILIDPKGNIVTGDAPRPSDEELVELFTELGI